MMQSPSQEKNFSQISCGLRRRVPMILQAEAAECGLACVAMVAAYYDQSYSLAELRSRFRVSLKGMTLRQLLDAAKGLGFDTRAVRLDIDELRELRLPSILHWQMNHFVVLIKVGKKHVTLLDPARGSRKVTFNEFSECFTGVAVELWPRVAFEEKRRIEPVRFSAILGKIHGLAKGVVQIFAVAFALEFLGLLIPLSSQWVIDHAIAGHDKDLLVSLTIGFAGIIVVQQILSVYRAWVLMYVGTSVAIRWRSNVFQHLISLPLRYFEQRHLGDVSSRFESADKILQTLSASFFGAVLDGFVAVVTPGMMFLYSPVLGSIAIAAMTLYAVLRTAFYPFLRSVTQEGIIKSAETQTHFLETLRGIRAIHLYGKQEVRRAGWLHRMVLQINANLTLQKLQLLFQSANALIFGIEGIMILYIGGGLVISGSLSIGMLVAFNAYKSSFNSRISALIDNFFSLKMLRVHGERLADIIHTPIDLKNDEALPTMTTSSEMDGTIAFDEVSFRYAHGEPTVISRATFCISPGESVAIVGRTGSGKTTLVNLMLGVLQPIHGEIRFGGRDLQATSPTVVRSIAGTVMQDDVLFAGSLLDNITFWDPAVDYVHLQKCIELCQLKLDIDSFPMGLHTLIGDMGSILSGGQKQRLLLARALYKRPKILFLDEATSNLDLPTETAINSALTAMKVTRVIVAHRPSTIASADRILHVAQARVVEIPVESYNAEVIS